ncbi:Transglutaminase-like superfamily protein [Methanoculleus chikugoensis]|uniref:Transglutaminase-like superfamily protein n=1 Tax=Methanoculleus chikugoensis TaxID=118126 RepID=A0A1M4MJA2_9EURY|nr:transglutaminase-like domain-containing protein [Methanoculleus chikugoensis]MDD4567350.1 transglutaminase-like domain-containing protein [Methanoculleus chikugoensis]NMA11378.1 transglutaminase domain-containing protein [Methanomicrobiales archaeon]SCL74922.1 Transglutaminase-like superfamily protein [Methanoculleus chikugoensis]
MVWGILNAIFLLSLLIPQGHLIYDGGGGDSGFGTVGEAGANGIALLSEPPPGDTGDALIDQVSRTTFACVDGAPRLFPAGINATLAHGVGDCTDLALLRAEVLRRNGVAARPVHGIMIWDTEAFRTNALHVEILGKGIAVHDWVELGDGRTMGAYEGDPAVRCVKIGEGVCFQPVFESLGYL